jgi:hypothetical protein
VTAEIDLRSLPSFLVESQSRCWAGLTSSTLDFARLRDLMAGRMVGYRSTHQSVDLYTRPKASLQAQER